MRPRIPDLNAGDRALRGNAISSAAARSGPNRFQRGPEVSGAARLAERCRGEVLAYLDILGR